MADLSKLKVALGQVEYASGQPSRNEVAVDAMVDRALDAGADVLVVPNSLEDASEVRLIGLNDSRIDVAGNVVMLDACGELYRIAVGAPDATCDFSICCDTVPYLLEGGEAAPGRLEVRMRPVGMRDAGRRVFAYDGGSAVFGPDGSQVCRLRDDFAEDLAVVSLGRQGSVAPRARRKLLSALVATIRRFDTLALPWKPAWVIGLSGGLDSSVVAALLVLALGPDRVVGYNLATRFNSATTIGNAASVARTLGIGLRNGSIEDMVVSLGNTLVQYGYAPDALRGLLLENAQARARGNLLLAFSAVEGGVVANNGNRVECALGYATLYGDAIGALAPIGDLTKVQLFQLARDINDELGCQAVPGNLLPRETEDGYVWQTMPSAELANGQTDPMKWFYHDWLVTHLQRGLHAGAGNLYDAAADVMQRYIEDRLEADGMSKWVRFYGLDDPVAFATDMDWVVSGMSRAAFKRVQAPPAITLAGPETAFARPESQVAPEPTSRYRALSAALRHARR